jgi:N-methylhydantoinase A
LTSETVPALVDTVHRFYEGQYGYSAPELPIVITSLEVTASAPRPAAPRPSASQVQGEAHIKSAEVHFRGSAHADVPFLRRDALPVGERIEGPAVIVEPYSTIPVPPGAAARVAEDTTLHITWPEEEHA